MDRKEAIRAIKQRLNFVDIARRYVELKRNGPRWVAPCPFHQETKPSFSINEEEGLFYCFGCQASGDIFEFYMRINGLDFKECLEQLALEAGIQLDAWRGQRQNTTNKQHVQEAQSAKKQILKMYQLATAHFVANLQRDDGAECRTYIERRGISPEIVQQFSLGWSLRDWQALAHALQRAGFSEKLTIESGLLGKSEKSGRGYDRFRGRLIFPIYNPSQQVIAFGGRVIGNEDEAKYINSADSPIYKKGDNLFGLSQARKAISLKQKLFLTEGYMDVLTLHQFGYANAVGVLGTALTPEQVKRISGFTSQVILLFDGDRAGRKAALRACEMLLVRGLGCSVVLMPEGEDIDSLLRTHGTEAFDVLVITAPDGLYYCTSVLKGLAAKEQVEWARNFLKNIEILELISPYATHISRHLGIAEDVLRQNTATIRQQKNTTQNRGARPVVEKSPYAKRDREILMFAVRYPHRLEDLKIRGVDLALTTSAARTLWEKIEKHGYEDSIHYLDEREKTFWVMCRTTGAPIDSGDKELHTLITYMDAFDVTMQQSSLSAAIRENAHAGDFASNLDYLRALQETLGRNNEQS